MHISDGILDLRYILTGFGVSGILTAYGLKKTDENQIATVAVMGAAFFAASLIHFKVGVTSIHLTLLGLIAIILGASSVPAILAGLFFQAVLFQHGGLTSLGVNCMIMMIPALLAQRFFKLLTVKRKDKHLYVATLSGIISFFAIILATFLSVIILILSDNQLKGFAAFLSISNIILALIEGVITAIVIYRLIKVKPEMIGSWK